MNNEIVGAASFATPGGSRVLSTPKRHDPPCATRISPTCVWLSDGTKVVLRTDRVMGTFYIEVVPQSDIRPMEVHPDL